MASDEVQQFTAAASYMNARGTEDPVVFVVERGRSTGPGRAMRAVLPVALVRRAYIYLGSTQNLLDGRETVHDDPRTARDSQRWWRSVERLLDADPIILRPAAFAVVGAGDLGEEISPGLTLVRGPTLPEAFAPAPFRQPAAQLHLIGSVGILVVWFVVGLGWAIALVPLEGLVRVGVAPALGIAMLALAGLIADRVGIRLSGVTGLTTVLVTAAAGAVGAWVLFRVRRDPPT